MTSIRHQLLVALLGAVLVTMIITAGATYVSARAEANTLSDYQLRQMALSLRDRHFGGGSAPSPMNELQEFDFVIQVWSQQGEQLYVSHPYRALPGLAQLGFGTQQSSDGPWRTYAVALHAHVIQVAQPLRVRSGLAAQAALRTMVPFVLLLPVLAALVWFLVGRGLRPLERVTASVAARSPGALDALDAGAVPVEVEPLVRALDDLLLRLRQALETQRAFTADAAHELRTPLAALQLQAQLLERADSEAARAQALAELKAGLQRAGRVVQQLLTLARQEPSAGAARRAPVALGALAAAVVAEQLPLAESRAIDLGITDSDAQAHCIGDAAALRVLIANLVENAVRYTPGGGRVDVAVRRDGPHCVIEVDDSGPGIPVEERERVFDRFYRREATAEPGSGLGLSIVRAIADGHGGRVALGQAALGGLRVSVHLPAAAATDGA